METVVRAHSNEEPTPLREERAGEVSIGEWELALGMTRHVLERVGPRFEQGGMAGERVG